MKDNFAKKTLFNTIGTFIYFFCQWLTTVLVVRITGYQDAGVFSLAITMTNIFYFVSLYGVRNFQLSDIENKYTPGNFFFVRVITTAVAVILFIITLFFLRFNSYTAMSCIAYMVFKCLESFTDLIFGNFQKINKYDSILISYVAKGITSLTIFVIFLKITGNLFFAISLMTLCYFLIILFYDVFIIKRNITITLEKKGTKKIIIMCFPLMLFSLIMPYMNFVTRYLIEKVYSSELLGYYSSISIIVVIMSTLAGCIWLVIIPTLSEMYINNQHKKIKSFIHKVIIGILISGILIIILAKLLGDFGLSLIFNKDILKYSGLLIPVVISSVFLTVSMFLNSVLISFKKNRTVLYCNLSGAVVCTLIAYPLIVNFNIYGANASLLIGILVQVITLYILLIKSLSENINKF